MTEEEKKMAEEYVDTLLAKDDAKLDKFLDEYLGDLRLTKKQAGAILGIIKGVGICSYLASLEAGRPKWHKVADGDLPPVSGRYWVYTGGEPFTLDFDTEFNSFGYWVVSLGDDWGVRDEDFETVKDRGEDEVIAWCEIPKYTEE